MFRLLLLAFCVATCGAVPVPMIRSNIQDGDEIVPGDFVELDASESTGATLFKWKVEPASFPDGKPTSRLSDDRKRLSLASRVGTYRIQLIVANDEDISDINRTIVVGKPSPAPAPFVPQPVEPDGGKFGLARDITTWGALVTTNRDKAAVLSQSYANLASQAAAGKFKTNDALAAATRDANRTILTNDALTAWTPFFAKLGERMSTLGKEGKLPGIEQTVLAYLEISDGLARLNK